MAYRSPARFLAPLAVLAAAGATYLIVRSGLDHGTSSSASTTLTDVRTVTTSSPAKTHQKSTYVVRAGDTLSAIAERTGVALDHLEALNPGIDPNALHAGQRLRLRSSP